jgi:dienelactone hydrolase
MRESPSWKVLQGHPVFEQLAAVSIERQRRYGGRPERFVELPAGDQAQPVPLLMTLHGNGDRGSASLAGWRAAAQEGWLVAALQSSQANAAEAYVWDDQELALREIAQHYAELRDRHELDVRQIVIAGFSMGGETALRAALGGFVPASGFVLLGPGGPTIDIAEDWLPLIAHARGSGLRGYVLIGERDTTIPHDAIRELVGLLQEGGIPCELEILPGLHHEYPRDPAPLLRALRFVRQAG